MADVRCAFYLRWPARPTGYQYLSLDIESRDGYGRLPVASPPEVQAKRGPLLDVFVEYAEGAFAEQVEADGDEAGS